MNSTPRLISCPNPACDNPVNPVENSACAHCRTPLIKRYVWAVGDVGKISPEKKVGDRYQVIAAQVWLDTQPGKLPDLPEKIPEETIPYLRLYPQRLHLPQVHGFVRCPKLQTSDILLLENIPVDETGNLYPAIAQSWPQATPTRQIYWLWQILQLWTPLSELGVATSLLKPDNIRVQGWCVRLLQLLRSEKAQEPSLQDLAQCWQPWVSVAKTQLAATLQKIVWQMSNPEADIATISAQINALLLASAAQLPLTIKMAGATDIGSEQLSHNEDACFPTANDSIDDPLLLQAAIICDGIGGHEGGEVASFLAMQSLKLQIRALVQDATAQPEIVPPEVLYKQFQACLRVANNIICNGNNEQKRAGTQRMATTVVAAVQIQQNIPPIADLHSQNAREFYIASVGDSRAYWIAANYCLLLTVDDDVVKRELSNARSFYHQARQRPDATALTQALGTKDGEFLLPFIERLLVEEDGILLLCSDGFSDNNLVERSWRDYALPVLKGEVSLEDALYSWMKLAVEKNGHDNISLVLIHCRVSSNELVLAAGERSQQLETPQTPIPAQSSQPPLDFDLSPSESEALPATVTTNVLNNKPHQSPLKFRLTTFLTVLLASITLVLLALLQFSPQGFQHLCQKFPFMPRQFCTYLK